MKRVILHIDESTEPWVDLRFSNGGVRFADLPNVPGFPRTVKQGEIFEIEMHDSTELLYRKRMQPLPSYTFWTELFRIAMPASMDKITARIRGF